MRAVDGNLELWAGASCPGVSAVTLSAVDASKDFAALADEERIYPICTVPGREW